MTSFDAIIIGGGHNGLVAAGMLAKAGKRVVVLEGAETTGGAARAHTFAPGFSTGGLAHLVNRFSPEVIKALNLPADVFAGTPAPTALIAPDKDAIVLRGGYGESITGLAESEIRAFDKLRQKLMFQASIFGRLLTAPPPSLEAPSLGEKLNLALTGLKLIGSGRQEARDFARMLLMNIADVADEYLTDDRLKGMLALDATLGIHLGPRSPTSLLGLYYRLTGAVKGRSGAHFLPKGGTAAMMQALETAIKAAGVTIRTGSPVKSITVDNGRATGVLLASGESLTAPIILSAIHPATTLLSLVGPRHLDTGLVRSVSHIRSKGNVAKLSLALKTTPQFSGLSAADHHGRIIIAPSMTSVENAFNPAKYGEYSLDPVMEITIPSLTSPALAPPGQAMLSALVQYAPYDLKQGWDLGREPFLNIILDTLEAHAPGLKASIIAAELLTPVDLEQKFHLPGGHWHHGELQADQLLVNRPTLAASRYETPVEGLYLASAGSHPGGGLSGLPGLLAAKQALKGARP